MNKETETQKQLAMTVGEYLAPDMNVLETEVWQPICSSDTGFPMGPEIPMFD